MECGAWAVESGVWGVGCGEWAAESGLWRVEWGVCGELLRQSFCWWGIATLMCACCFSTSSMRSSTVAMFTPVNVEYPLRGLGQD